MTNRYTLRFRTINRNIFLDIKSGKKSVETRAASERYKNVKAGDAIVLVCGKERFEKKVKKAKIFKSIKALLKIYPVKKIMPDFSTEKEMRGAYYSYPGYKEKIQKYGIIALELK
jgi:ASC-1-like (ASCH) protein